MISYEPLFKTMKAKNISTYSLIDKMGFSRATYYHSIKKGKHINTSTVCQLCELLECEVQDIIQYLPPKKLQPSLDDNKKDSEI